MQDQAIYSQITPFFPIENPECSPYLPLSFFQALHLTLPFSLSFPRQFLYIFTVYHEIHYQLSVIIKKMQQNKATAEPITQTTIPSLTDWHASEIAAADPCNSAIKKISGKEIYLKDKPEALILLQSAQIQRLTNYLNDYKCKYRSLSRQPLDRQSYEVQIKQLFERDANNKVEIERLNRTIGTITITGEQYKKQLLAAQEKYKVLLGENGTIRERNTYLEKELKFNRDNFDKYIAKSQAEIHSLNGQLASHKTYTDSVLKNNADLLARVNAIPNIERRIFELETQLRFSLDQNERLNKDLEARGEKLINQDKVYTILYEKYNSVILTNDNLKKEIASHTQTIDSHKLLASKLQIQNQQVKDTHDLKIKETSKVLGKKSEEVEALSQQIKDYNARMFEIQRLNEDLRTGLADLENNNSLLRQDIVKLNDNIKLHQTRIAKYETDEASLKKLLDLKESEWQAYLQSQKTKELSFVSQLTSISERYSKQIKELQDQMAKITKENAELASKLDEAEKNLHVARGQLKLSQQIIKTQQAQNARLTSQEEVLKSTKLEKDTLSKTIGTKKAEIAQIEKALKQGKQRQKQLLTKITDLTQRYEQLNTRFTAQNISLNKMIHNKVTESETLKKMLISNENELRDEFQNAADAYKKTIDEHLIQIAKTNEEKTALANEHTELKAKHQQTAKLKSELEQKQEELSSLYHKEQARSLLLEIALKKQAQTASALKDEEATLKTQIAQKGLYITQLQNQIKAIRQEKEASEAELSSQKDLINKLKIQSIKFHVQRSCYDMQIHDKGEEIQKLQKQISHLNEQIANLNQEKAKLIQEREQLSLMFQGKTKENEGLKRRMIELQSQMRDSFEQALKETENKHSKAYELLKKEKEGLDKKIEEIEPHIELASSLKKHKETLEENLKTAAVNTENEKAKAQKLAEQIAALNKAIVDNELRLKTDYEGKISTQAEKHATELGQLRKDKDLVTAERDSLFQINNEYQTKTSLLVQQIDRLHTILNNSIAQGKADADLHLSTAAALKSQAAQLSSQLAESKKKQSQLSTSYKILSKRLVYYQELLSNLQSQFIAIQLMTGELRQERDLLIKKNAHIVKSIRALSNELDNLETQGDNMAQFFTKESTIHKDLNKRYALIQKMFNDLDSYKVVVQETVEITEIVKN